MFSSRFWLGILVGIIVMFVLMFLVNVDADSVREVLKDVFGSSKGAHAAMEHARIAAAFFLGIA